MGDGEDDEDKLVLPPRWRPEYSVCRSAHCEKCSSTFLCRGCSR